MARGLTPTPLSYKVSLWGGASGAFLLFAAPLTWALIQTFLWDMLILMDPLSVALEEYLHGWSCFASESNRVTLDDVGIFRLLYEMRQCSRGWWDGIGKNFTIVGSWKIEEDIRTQPEARAHESHHNDESTPAQKKKKNWTETLSIQHDC